MTEVKETFPQPRTRVEVIYAGGTISSLATTSGYREGGHIVDLVARLSERIPDFTRSFDIGQPQVAYTGLSENMDYEYWKAIGGAVKMALEHNPNGIIITHGTDSMEHTARYLQRSLGQLIRQKGTRVILTGANEDLSHPQTDAWDNLSFALNSTNGEAEAGVYVAFHGKLIPADLVVKEPYNDSEMNYTSLQDPEYLQAVKAQEEHTATLIVQMRGVARDTLNVGQAIEYPVNVVRANHQGLWEQIKDKDVKAMLFILYHSGTANTEKPDLSVSELVKKLRTERGIVSFGVTENGEPVNLHSYETSVKLREAGVVPLYDMVRQVALAKLHLVLSNSSTDTIDRMLKSIAGEISEDLIITEDVSQLKKDYST